MIKRKKIFYIGETVLHNGIEKIVMDTDMLNASAKIGQADENGLVWESEWISWDNINFIA